MKTITLKMLEEKGACDDEREAFRRAFGEAVTLRSEAHAVETAKQHHFNLYWAALHLLTPEARKAYYAAKREAHETFRDAGTEEAHEAYNSASVEALARLYYNQ